MKIFSILSNVQTVFQSAAFSFSQPTMWTMTVQVPSLRHSCCNSLLVSDDLDQAMWHTPVFLRRSFGQCVMLWAILPLFISQALSPIWRRKNSRIELDIDYDILYRRAAKFAEINLLGSFSHIIIIILGAMLCLELLLCLRRLLWSQPTESPPTMLALETKEAEKTKGMIDLGTPNFCFFFNQNFDAYSLAMHGGSGLP